MVMYMLKILIIDDNLNYATNLMNFINKKNDNIKVCGIVDNGEDAIKELNSNCKFDIIILDLKMPKYNGKEVLDRIKNKKRYEKSFIIISGEIELIRELIKNNMICTVLHKNIGMQEIVDKLNQILADKEDIKSRKEYRNKIISELNFLGYDMSYKGTKYLIDAIEYIVLNNNKEVCNLEKNVYSMISKKYNDSIHNVKCNISRANNNMYYECEIEKLKKYFYLDKDLKPKTKTIINVITNKIIHRI